MIVTPILQQNLWVGARTHKEDSQNAAMESTRARPHSRERSRNARVVSAMLAES